MEEKEFVKKFLEVSCMAGKLYDLGFGIKESVEKAKKDFGATDQSKTPKNLNKSINTIIAQNREE